MTLQQILDEVDLCFDPSDPGPDPDANRTIRGWVRLAYKAGRRDIAYDSVKLHHNSYGKPVCQQCGGDPR